MNYSVNEGDGGILVCASIVSGILERTVTLYLSTQDGSATSSSTGPRDFSAITTELTFDPRTSVACANISVKDDGIVEGPESFMVMLSGSDPGVNFVAPTTAIVIINDNDKVTVGFEMDRYNGEEGQTAIVCATVKGSMSLERLVLVHLSTSDSTASGLKITFNMWGNLPLCQVIRVYALHFYLQPLTVNNLTSWQVLIFLSFLFAVHATVHPLAYLGGEEGGGCS